MATTDDRSRADSARAFSGRVEGTVTVYEGGHAQDPMVQLDRRLSRVEITVDAVKTDLGNMRVEVATSASDLTHMRQSLDSVLSAVRWVVLLVLAGVIAALLNLVIPGLPSKGTPLDEQDTPRPMPMAPLQG